MLRSHWRKLTFSFFRTAQGYLQTHPGTLKGTAPYEGRLVAGIMAGDIIVPERKEAVQLLVNGAFCGSL